jgi:hypothetical protein
MNFDVELLGDCDTIIAHLCKELGGPWSDVLEGFQIPNVSKEFLTPFIQTPPDSPSKAGCKEVVVDVDSEKKCYDLEKSIIQDSLDEFQNEHKGNFDYVLIKLYIIQRCNSTLKSDIFMYPLFFHDQCKII